MRGGGHSRAEKGKHRFLETVMAAHPAMFGRVTQKATQYRFQVLVSEVVEGDGGAPARLVRHGYRLDQEYFWPASAIKLCGAVAAVQKVSHLRELLGRHYNRNSRILLGLGSNIIREVQCAESGRHHPTVVGCLIGVDMNYTTPITLYPLFEGGFEEKVDPSNLDEPNITIAHEIRKLFLVSDTAAFNRLYEFVGHHGINRAMWSLGLLTARLQHRLNVFWTPDENRYCSPVGFKLRDRSLTLPPKKSNLAVPDNSGLPGVHVGTAYVTEDDQLVPEPMDFSRKNYMSLLDLQTLLIKVVRRDVELDSPPLRLAEGARMMLMEAMSQYPSDSSNPKYKKSEYPDDYCKFFLPGLSRVRSKGALRVFNKPGRAYGFTVENSYIFDVETGRSFFLSAVVYTNRNGILNDDKYEYTDVADRLMADLGEVVARAIWQIPPCYSNLSSPFDCIPSSLWAACSCPLIQDSPPGPGNIPHIDTKEGKGGHVEEVHNKHSFAAAAAAGHVGADDAKVIDVNVVHFGSSFTREAGLESVVSSSRATTTRQVELPVSADPLVLSSSKSSDISATGEQASEPSIPLGSSSSADLPLSFHAFSSPEMQTPAEQILARLGSLSFTDSFHPGNSLVEAACVANPATEPADVNLASLGMVRSRSSPSPGAGGTLVLDLLNGHVPLVDAISVTEPRSVRSCYRYFLDA